MRRNLMHRIYHRKFLTGNLRFINDAVLDYGIITTSDGVVVKHTDMPAAPGRSNVNSIGCENSDIKVETLEVSQESDGPDYVVPDVPPSPLLLPPTLPDLDPTHSGATLTSATGQSGSDAPTTVRRRRRRQSSTRSRARSPTSSRATGDRCYRTCCCCCFIVRRQ